MLLGDLKYAARLLLKTPTTSVACILTFAIAIGANTAVFSILYGALLRPLPFPDSERLVAVSQVNRRDGRPAFMSMPDFAYFEQGADDFQSLAGYHITSFNLNVNGTPEQLEGALVTREFFSTLRVPAAEGRVFMPGDLDGTVIISDSLWKREFHADSHVIGRSVLLDGRSAVIVGVAPPGLWFPGLTCQIWRLLTSDSYLLRGNRDYHFLYVFGRLKKSTRAELVLAQLNTLNGRLAREHPDLNASLSVTISSLARALDKNARSSLLILMTTVAFVLVIACVNIASLQLSRLLHRGGEFAVRAWLGASRACIFRQLLVENLLLSLVGGSIGLALAEGGVKLTLSVNAASIPRSHEVKIDVVVLVFNLAVCLVAGLFCSLAPLSQFFGRGSQSSTRMQGGRATEGRKTRLLQHALVAAEIGVALVLLISVNLMVRSFQRLSRVDVGFDTARLIAVSIRLPNSTYSTSQDLERFRKEVYTSISTVPGVAGVAECSDLPLVAGFQNYFSIKGQAPLPSAEREMVLQSSVSANFFRTMGISVKRGREFSEFDTEKTLRAAVVNETMVRSYWRGRNPLGSQLRHGLPDEPTAWYTVVGVVQDTLPLIGSHSVPEIFTPYTQVPEGYVNLLSRPLTVMVKVGAANASALVPDLQKAVTSVDASLTSDVRTMDGIVAHSLVDPKFRTVMIATFGTIAFWLSIIGTYGVISGFIAGETRNIGIRTALGATPYSILMLFVRRGMTIVAIGIVLGLTLALSLLRIIRGVLYEVSPTDPMAFLLAVSVLFSASLVAVYLPASRTARVDPVEALREQ